MGSKNIIIPTFSPFKNSLPRARSQLLFLLTLSFQALAFARFTELTVSKCLGVALARPVQCLTSPISDNNKLTTLLLFIENSHKNISHQKSTLFRCVYSIVSEMSNNY